MPKLWLMILSCFFKCALDRLGFVTGCFFEFICKSEILTKGNKMKLEYNDFVHPSHFGFFVAAAQEYKCHILVRKTGRAALSWVGRPGYTGKRGDLKAKTSDINGGQFPTAGLVCSPFLYPQVFTAERLAEARRLWVKYAHFITTPNNNTGFDDKRPVPASACRTPYIVQTKRGHKHYGCVALVDMGLLTPRYVHGDYDLYAIIPAGERFDEKNLNPTPLTLDSSMSLDVMTLQERVNLSVPNLVGPLTFRVGTYINNRIAENSPDLLGALMVNHGEEINLKKEEGRYQPVLAFMPKQVNGQWARILSGKTEHEQYYYNA